MSVVRFGYYPSPYNAAAAYAGAYGSMGYYPQQSPAASTQSAPVPFQPQSSGLSLFERDTNIPPLPAKAFSWNVVKRAVLHPIRFYRAYKALKANPHPQEPTGKRLAMYVALEDALAASSKLTRAQQSPGSQLPNLGALGREYLADQLAKGRLTDNRSDNGRSTLSHLYNIIATPRYRLFNTNDILQHTLRVLAKPETITQKFSLLDNGIAQALIQHYQSGAGPRLSEPITPDLLMSITNGTCVAASVMYYNAKRNPAEFVRHISEITSPRLAFWERVYASEVSPDNPALAAQKLAEYEVQAAAVPGSNGSEFWVRVQLPQSGVIRALNQQKMWKPGTQSIVESIYQGALTRLAVSSYDAGLDRRINPDGTIDPVPGLEDDRKTLLESIIKDNGGVMSVNYQNTLVGRTGTPFLLGYYRHFDQTTRDLIEALNMGEDVIVGITWSEANGDTGGNGHEFTITDYEIDPRTGEVIFTIADSDDDNPRLIKQSAAELIPQIHHAGLPVKLAKRVQGEITANRWNGLYTPTARDAMRYKLQATVAPQYQQAFIQDYYRMLQEEEMMMRQQEGLGAYQQQWPMATANANAWSQLPASYYTATAANSNYNGIPQQSWYTYPVANSNQATPAHAVAS